MADANNLLQEAALELEFTTARLDKADAPAPEPKAKAPRKTAKN